MIHVILSAPKPSEAAKFIGQILSIINSTILDRFPGYAPFVSGDFEPTLPVGLLPVGEIPFLLDIDELVDDLLLEGEPIADPNVPLLIFYLVSYTKSTAC